MSKEKVEKIYSGMSMACYSHLSVREFARQIKEVVANGSVEWAELSFTEMDLDVAIQMALVRDLKKSFKNISDPVYSKSVVDNFRDQITDAVQSGAVSWGELGFTHEQLTQRCNERMLAMNASAATSKVG